MVYCDLASSQFISHKARKSWHRYGFGAADGSSSKLLFSFLTVIFSGFVAEIRGRNTVIIIGEGSRHSGLKAANFETIFQPNELRAVLILLDS